MKPYYQVEGLTLYNGDCREVMAALDENSIDAIVTDPPYGIGFMGKDWDSPGGEGDFPLRRFSAINTVNTGVTRQGGRQRSGEDFVKRQARDARAFQDWSLSWSAEAFRVLKPGGHLVVFGSPRTYHRMACAIEDAGFEIRDCLQYLFGSGFPKSLQVNKDARFCHCEPTAKYDVRGLPQADLSPSLSDAPTDAEDVLDRVSEQSLSADARAELPAAEVRGREPGVEGRSNDLQDSRQLHGSPLRAGAGVGEADGESGRLHHGAPADHGGVVRLPDDAGRGREPHRPQPDEQRPIESRTLADERRSQEGGVWPLCDRCGKPSLPSGLGTALKPAYEPIVLARKPLTGTVAANVAQWGTGGLNIDATRIGDSKAIPASISRQKPNAEVYGKYGIEDGSGSGWNPNIGRWPANVLLDAEAAAQLDAMSGATVSREGSPRIGMNGDGWGLTATGAEYNDRGGASRFFYTAKTSKAEREFGLDDLEPARRSDGREKDIENPRLRTNERRNDHPTVKPVDLMRWLCRLITPPGGIVLDPFLGSGSTGMAALDGGFRFVGIDLEAHYIEIAKRRIARRHAIEPLPQRDEGQAVLL